jgi:hypothetical protein
MKGNDEAMHGILADVRFGFEASHNPVTPTPARRAVERIKRKATGMAIAAADELCVEGVLGVPEEIASDSFQPRRASTCRCPDADVKAYRDGAEWICHTCGHELSASASHQLTARVHAAATAHSPRARHATHVQRPIP